MRMRLHRGYLRLRELYALPSIDAFGLLLSYLPTITRYLNFNILDERVSLFTTLGVAGQGYLIAGTLGHFVLAVDDRDHLANSFCAVYVAVYVFLNIGMHYFKRNTMRRLYHELVQYNQEYIQNNSSDEHAKTVESLPRELPILIIGMLFVVWFNWFLYTTSPLIFEWVRGKPVGSTKRISTPVWPYLCDINTTPCFELNYVIVALVWFFGVTAFVASVGLTQSYYMYISFMFRALGVSVKNVRKDAVTAVRNSKEFEGEFGPTHEFLVYAHMHRLLNLYIKQHQFLIRWSKEYTAINCGISIMMMIAAPCAIGLAGLKLMTDENYVLDEVPFILGTILVNAFILCWFAHMLHDASVWMHWAVYTSDWVYADHALRLKINVMMIRSLKPLVTEHGLIGAIVLDSFVQVVKSSYSFLQAMHSITA